MLVAYYYEELESVKVFIYLNAGSVVNNEGSFEKELQQGRKVAGAVKKKGGGNIAETMGEKSY